MPTPQEQLVEQRYRDWWVQVGYWVINQGGGVGAEEPAPIVGVIIDTNGDRLVDIDGNAVAATEVS
jgi:hypothetical protein